MNKETSAAKSVQKSVLEKIESGEVKPLGRAWFVLGHVILWCVLAVTVLIGGAAVGVLLHEIFGVEWGQVHLLGRGGVPGFVLVLPYVWFLMLGLTLLVAWFLFVHTGQGYKRKPLLIVGVAVLISAGLGSVMYASRVAERFDRAMVEGIPPYAEMQIQRQGLWVRPEQGIVAGVVAAVEEGGQAMTLNDAAGVEWYVGLEEVRPVEAVERFVVVGEPVLVLGKPKGEAVFEARELRPFRPGVLERIEGRVKMRQRAAEMLRNRPLHSPMNRL